MTTNVVNMDWWVHQYVYQMRCEKRELDEAIDQLEVLRNSGTKAQIRTSYRKQLKLIDRLLERYHHSCWLLAQYIDDSISDSDLSNFAETIKE